MGALVLVLALGALATLYPFASMVFTAFKGPSDQNDNRLLPRFWFDLGELEAKYVEDKYSGDASRIASSRVGASLGHLVPEYERFLLGLPEDLWTAGFRTAPTQVTGRLALRYQDWLRDRYRSIDELNRAYIEENVAFQTVSPPVEMCERPGWSPTLGRKWEDWILFKRTLPAEFRIPIREERIWQEWLRARFGGRFEDVPPEIAGEATRFEEITRAPGHPLYALFLEEGMPESLRGRAPDVVWEREHRAALPIVAAERAHVERFARALRWEFSTRNFRYVLDYVAINGRALWVTIVFCGLAVVTQLLVNPLAAYALSRYPIRASGKILLFLLATMAFPAEVTLIPSFLLLRDLGLLNTFAALVLPAAASGYSIFLLKGFFDSLPAELFESGQIDGARELTLMTRIALPLSKPVLGYMGLLAFMGAYGAFMYAFLVAQDQRMWTLMVWIYQLQSVAPKAVMMAAITLAALPTMLVFLFAQRVIARGIVLPGER